MSVDKEFKKQKFSNKELEELLDEEDYDDYEREELEEEMNIKIFTRSTRGITLTSDGVEFLSYARQIVEQTELLEENDGLKLIYGEILIEDENMNWTKYSNNFDYFLKDNDLTTFSHFTYEATNH